MCTHAVYFTTSEISLNHPFCKLGFVYLVLVVVDFFSFGGVGERGWGYLAYTHIFSGFVCVWIKKKAAPAAAAAAAAYAAV